MKVVEILAGLIIGAAIINVLVNPQAATASVINAGGTQVNSILGTLTKVS